MISCDQHDYIEIACTFRYPIRITMKQASVIECTAIDTALNDKRLECIKVETEGTERLIVLDDISSLEVCIQNPHFQKVTFS